MLYLFNFRISSKRTVSATYRRTRQASILQTDTNTPEKTERKRSRDESAGDTTVVHDIKRSNTTH